jgi:DNA-binding XRE family transcriptional regulator
MLPEVLAEYEDDYQFFYGAAMRETEFEGEGAFPEEVIARILAGEHPVKVFRQYRRISQEQLARRVGISFEYIRKIESGKCNATRTILSNIANILRVEYSDIV